MGVRVVVRDGETVRQAWRRLKTTLQLSRLGWEARRRGCPADATQERRYKAFQRRRKARRATLLAQLAGEQPVASAAEAVRRYKARTGRP